MKKILVPCDFSEQAVNALRFAIDVASQSKGEVHVVNVIELPVMHDTMLMPVLSFEEALFQEMREKAEKQFKKLKEKYGAGSRIKASVLFGPTAKTILEYSKNNQIEVVVMGTRGVSGIREILIGSNTEKIVRGADVPVIAIKKYMKASSIKTIVFPNTLDTENQEDLVMKVKTLQNFFKAKLRIVWINTPTNFTPDRITFERLKGFAKRFMFKDFSIDVYNDPFEESGIINYAHAINADLIAMGTHGRKGLAHVLSGSVAEDVVNHVDCPIWTYALKD